MPRCLLLRVADELTDHPGPSVSALQGFVALCVIDTGLALFALARRLRLPGV